MPLVSPVIDPLEAMLALARADTGLASVTSNQIARKHKFKAGAQSQSSWKTPSKALVIRYDVGGQQDIYVSDQCVRLAAECYGEDESQAGLVYTGLIALFRVDDRRVVTTRNGQALIYWVVPDGTPLSSRNEDIKQDFIGVPLKICVAEQPVG